MTHSRVNAHTLSVKRQTLRWEHRKEPRTAGKKNIRYKLYLKYVFISSDSKLLSQLSWRHLGNHHAMATSEQLSRHGDGAGVAEFPRNPNSLMSL